MTAPDQPWCVWNVTLDRRANPNDMTQREANEMAADFSHNERSCNFVARAVDVIPATDLLSELSAADNASRPSYALAELCKRAAERIRADWDATQKNNEAAGLDRMAHDATKRERDMLGIRVEEIHDDLTAERSAHAATKRELELSVEVVGFLARHWAVGRKEVGTK